MVISFKSKRDKARFVDAIARELCNELVRRDARSEAEPEETSLTEQSAATFEMIAPHAAGINKCEGVTFGVPVELASVR